ncbi:MAG TPA: glutamine synthetase, partial [Chloroflexota bacterium]
MARAREGNVRLVRFLYCDNGGIIRGKASHVRGLSERLHGGLALTVAMQAMSGVDRLATVQG